MREGERKKPAVRISHTAQKEGAEAKEEEPREFGATCKARHTETENNIKPTATNAFYAVAKMQ